MELNRLYYGDCLEIMPQIADKSVDMICCDLPYGTTKNKWDSVISLERLWEQYERVIKDNGAIVLFAQMPFTAVLASSNLSLLKYELIWEKESGTGFLNANYAPLKSHENILVFSKAPAAYTKTDNSPMKYNPQMESGVPYKCKQGGIGANYDYEHNVNVTTVNEGNRYPKTILRFCRDKDKYHPTQKPVELIRYLIRTYTDEGETVLDNTCGSGTTAIAAIKEKRNWICIEKDDKYYEIAKKRIEQEQAQLSLF